MGRLLSEANWRLLFRISLLLKLAHSVVETAAGLVLLVVSAGTIMQVANFLTQNELREDPRDVLANLVLHGAQALSIDERDAVTFFLLSHGLVELGLVTAIYLSWRWAYPAFRLALGLLAAYQIYQLSLAFSWWLFVLMLFDIGVIMLTWHEYKVSRRHVVDHPRSARS